MTDKMDMKISGCSTMPGGDYGLVSISGSGKIKGNVKCDRLSCSGSAKVEGDVIAGDVGCSGSVKIEGSLVSREQFSASGSFRCTGAVQTELLKCSGSFEAAGPVSGGELRISGSIEAKQGIHCRDFRASGSCRIQGDLEAELVRLSGRAEIPGLLNAETVEISANSLSEIGDIGGGTIRIRRDINTRRIFGISFPRSAGPRVNSIEGDTVELENTEAKIVRGKHVIIGADCKIGRVEYSESFQAEEGTVAEAVRI